MRSNVSFIPKVPKEIYLYAKRILKSRFRLGEKIVSKNAFCSYWYARDILKGRFELGEGAISENALYSYWYAVDVIKGRFKLGEKIILNSVWADPYRKFLNEN